MSVVDKFIDYVHDEVVEHPEKSWEKMVFGFQANKLKTRILPKKNLSKGYQKLETMMMALVADALKDQGSYVWGNIFAPCEIIDRAQNSGIAPTLCSYHKTFIGGVESGAVKHPEYAVTTSLSCDGNLNTFRYLEKKIGVPYTFLDVPYADDEASSGGALRQKP